MWLGLGKQVLFTRNTLVHIVALISCCVCAIQNLLVFWIPHEFQYITYDNILDKIIVTDVMLLYYKLSLSSQIIYVDKTSFPLSGHILCNWTSLVNNSKPKAWHFQQGLILLGLP